MVQFHPFHPLMRLDSLRKAECYDENCTYHHIKGTKRQPALVKNTQQSCQKSSQPEKEKPTTDIISQENENQTGHFLEVIRLMKAEILSEMNQQIASLTAQIQSIQPPQHQVVTPQLMPYPQQAIPQSINPLMFTPLPPRGAQQPIQRMQFQTTQTIYVVTFRLRTLKDLLHKPNNLKLSSFRTQLFLPIKYLRDSQKHGSITTRKPCLILTVTLS